MIKGLFYFAKSRRFFHKIVQFIITKSCKITILSKIFDLSLWTTDTEKMFNSGHHGPEIRLILRARGRMDGVSRACAVNTSTFCSVVWSIYPLLRQNINLKATFTRTQSTNFSSLAIIMCFLKSDLKSKPYMSCTGLL